MKTFAILLVVVGVALAAAFGARNTDTLVERQNQAIPGTHFANERDGAQEAYCDARKKAELSDHPECEKTSSPAPDPKTFETLVAKAQKDLAAIKTLQEELPKEVFEKREAWLEAYAAAIEPEATQAMISAPPAPGSRLTAWATSNGLFFAVGIILMVIGGMLTRKLNREAATGTSPDSDESAGPVDFGALLNQLRQEAANLHTTLAANQEPALEDFEQAQQQIEAMQFERIEPLIDNRAGLQVRYGIGAYAQVLGPMSAGERNLNRAWSALVDEHWPEAVNALQTAVIQLDEACKQMDDVVASAA